MVQKKKHEKIWDGWCITKHQAKLKKKAILNGKKLPSEGQCSKLESFESCNSMASDFPFKKMQDTYDVSSKV